MELHPNRQYPPSDPRYHTASVKVMLHEMITHLRDDTSKINAPKALALFETSAEILQALWTAFDRYEKGAEPALREQGMPERAAVEL